MGLPHPAGPYSEETAALRLPLARESPVQPQSYRVSTFITGINYILQFQKGNISHEYFSARHSSRPTAYFIHVSALDYHYGDTRARLQAGRSATKLLSSLERLGGGGSTGRGMQSACSPGATSLRVYGGMSMWQEENLIAEEHFTLPASSWLLSHGQYL